MTRLSGSGSLLRGVLVVLGWGLLVSAARSADHRDAPLLANGGPTDINDLYIFQSPSDRNSTVLVMTVNPFAGMISPLTLDPEASYEFLIDDNGDAVEDTVLRLTFGPPDRNGVQRVTLSGNLPRGQGRGRGSDRGRGPKDELIASGSTERNVPIRGGGRLRVAIHDDPFFFDLNGFRAFVNGAPMPFTGDDAFADANITAIILEIPSERLGAQHIAVWSRTEVDGVQIDRNGRPAINTVLIPGPLKNAFNDGIPRNDVEDFGDVVIGTLRALGNDQATAEALAGALLPDVNTFNTRSAAGFLNGRRLADDVIDAELNLLVPHDPSMPLSDLVDANDKAFLNQFPYLAAPHDLP